MNTVAHIIFRIVAWNFVYEKEGQKRKKVMSYRSAFPQDRVFTWDDVKFLLKGQYIFRFSFVPERMAMIEDTTIIISR